VEQAQMLTSEGPGKALSIVIVNWNSCAFLRNCLKSIYAAAGATTFEVIVVDNASFDGSKEMAEAEFPEVRFIQSSTNSGFAKANNLGFAISQGESLLFLNPDTEIVGTALETLESALQSIPDAGIVGARLLNGDLSLQISAVQAFPSIWNQVLDMERLRQWFPKARLWGIRALIENTAAATAVDAISGACLMIKRQVFEQVNGFSPDYFMYSEDTDLCFKVMTAGFKSYYVRDARVIHFGGQSSALSSEGHFASVMMRESLKRFFGVRRGSPRATLYQLAMALSALCRLLVIAVVFVLSLGTYRKDGLRNAFVKWFRVFRWSVGLEAWAKKSA
jgi:GT2 family glycosyltransferase